MQDKFDAIHPIEPKSSQMIPVRLSVDEVTYLNFLQGGQFIDRKTGLREFSRLKKIIRIPEIRNLFIELVDRMKSGKGVPEEMKKTSHAIEEKENVKDYYEPVPSDQDPEIQRMESYGDGEDKKIVMMPEDVVNFLDILKGSIEKDPTMHLEEFGLFGGGGGFFGGITKIFHEPLRIAATVGGAILGGPVGAAAGNFAGKVLTGAKAKDNIWPAAKVGAATWGLGQMAGLAGSAMPGLATAAPGVFGSGATWGATPGFISNMAGTTGATAGVGAAAAKPAATSGFLDTLKGNASWLAPAASIAAGAHFSQKAAREQAKMMREIERERRQEARELRQRYGLDEPLGEELKLFPHDVKAIREGRPAFKAGGHLPRYLGRPIVGKGKGQEDLIKDDGVKEGGWIWDATTTAHFGDGSTKAGQDTLKKFEAHIVKKAGDLKKHALLDHGKPPKKVPCALSDGERYTPPEIVTAAGGGSNEKGAALFRAMTKDLRKLKISNGDELPPPAPDIIKLFKKVA